MGGCTCCSPAFVPPFIAIGPTRIVAPASMSEVSPLDSPSAAVVRGEGVETKGEEQEQQQEEEPAPKSSRTSRYGSFEG